MTQLSCVVLAAGSSRRMGEDKLLLDVRGRPMLDWALDALLELGPREIVVVHRPGAAALVERIKGRGGKVLPVENPRPEVGMLSSLKCGLERIASRGEIECVVMALGDQPLVGTGTIQELVRSFSRGDSEVTILAHHGKKGHPVAFSWRVAEEFLRAPDALQVRDVLHRFSGSTEIMEVDDAGVLVDVDDRRDYDALQGHDKV